MRMTRPRFCLPPPEKPNPLWAVLSAALHIVLWDLAGMTNKDALDYMRSIELVPAAAR